MYFSVREEGKGTGKEVEMGGGFLSSLPACVRVTFSPRRARRKGRISVSGVELVELS